MGILTGVRWIERKAYRAWCAIDALSNQECSWRDVLECHRIRIAGRAMRIDNLRTIQDFRRLLFAIANKLFWINHYAHILPNFCHRNFSNTQTYYSNFAIYYEFGGKHTLWMDVTTSTDNRLLRFKRPKTDNLISFWCATESHIHFNSHILSYAYTTYSFICSSL